MSKLAGLVVPVPSVHTIILDAERLSAKRRRAADHAVVEPANHRGVLTAGQTGVARTLQRLVMHHS